jgi:membrane associated rhomboid family serine protease
MIVIPTGTDAPIYHWPYATIGLIIVNIALFLAVPPVTTSPEIDEEGNVIEEVHKESTFERYALAMGDGRLHPHQWVTHNFLHYGLLHLAGNMLFLWAFGIVVEGKLGVIKYLLTYLAIGTLHGALLQLLLMNSAVSGHAAGASAMVYGLLCVCLVWAPRNELNCIVIILTGLRTLVFHWDLYYTTVALLYVGEQVFGLFFWGSIEGKLMVAELGHLSGAFWGLVVGVALLKGGLVDCEGWDLFSLWSKNRKLARDWKARGKQLDLSNENRTRSVRANVLSRSRRRRKGDEEEPGRPGSAKTLEERGASAMRRIRRLIDERAAAGAVDAYQKAARALPNWPSQAELYGLIKSLHAQGAEVESLPLMRDHCRLYPREAPRVRLKLAQVLIRDCQRPLAAIRLLQELSEDAWPADLQRARRKLIQQAEAMREEGVLELEEDV